MAIKKPIYSQTVYTSLEINNMIQDLKAKEINISEIFRVALKKAHADLVNSGVKTSQLKEEKV